ncbi:MAG: hypothetical protein OXJ56_10075 [Rhodospirillaceae bacterium]|nr:hypothetical protein [Rhodospirillaceae bacterium]
MNRSFTLTVTLGLALALLFAGQAFGTATDCGHGLPSCATAEISGNDATIDNDCDDELTVQLTLGSGVTIPVVRVAAGEETTETAPFSQGFSSVTCCQGATATTINAADGSITETPVGQPCDD